MATSIEVLCPNGRRQIVKITPQTSILQVLEEVCTRQGFPAAEYTLKHGRTILDMGIFRYSGLPNNAKLELIKSEKVRIETQVQVALQLEDGCRIQSVFAPSTFLWDILIYWNNENSSPKKGQILKIDGGLHPVCVYMREEIIGEAALKYTSLRALGITCGNVILRLIHRVVPQCLLDSINTALHKEQQKLELLKAKALSEQQDITSTSWQLPSVPEVMDYIENNETENVLPVLPPSTNTQNISLNKKKPRTSSTRPGSSFADFKFPEETKGKSLYNINDSNDFTDIHKVDSELPRASVVFHLNEIQLEHEDYSEEFFDVTIEDVRKRMISLQQERVALEQQPFTTKAMREALDQERLMKYEYVIIRIQFPDRFVLQGKFKPTEKVQDVKKFIQDHLANPNHPFYLFTTPPRKLLQNDDTLLQAQLVPASIVHFGSESLPEFCLSKSVQKKSSTFELANLSAKLNVRPFSRVLPHAASTSLNVPHPLTPIQQPVSSNLHVAPQSIRAASPSSHTGSVKVPKWFQKSKKQ